VFVSQAVFRGRSCRVDTWKRKRENLHLVKRGGGGWGREGEGFGRERSRPCTTNIATNKNNI
jgi:hypothetical protein